MNRDWRVLLIEKFLSNSQKITIVSDSDGLLNDQMLFSQLQENGFDSFVYTNSIELRFLFESKYRNQIKEGKRKLIIVVKNRNIDFLNLPYDFTEKSKKISVGFAELFPFLHPSVFKMIDTGFINHILNVNTYKGRMKKLGYKASMKFLLKYGFQIDLDLINNSSQLLSTLFKIHYEKEEMAKELKELLVEELIDKEAFKKWPLHQLFFNQEDFFAFLQERWPVFIESFFSDEKDQVNEALRVCDKYTLKYEGPPLLPFQDKTLKIYFPNFFYENLLHPVKLENFKVIEEEWIKPGIIFENNSFWKLQHQIKSLSEKIPPTNANYKKWIDFAFLWSRLLYFFHDSELRKFKDSIDNLREKIDSAFLIWLQSNYSSLASLSPSKPVMVHQIPKKLRRELEEDANKMALIVVDGLSLEQWFFVKDSFTNVHQHLTIEENALFSWIPTLTSVSRQAIFSGMLPIHFADSIFKTDKEERYWRYFWTEHGVSKKKVYYGKFSGNEAMDVFYSEGIFDHGIEILGLVINKIDEIMHGMQNGSMGMKSQIKLWCENSFLNKLILKLVKEDYSVWITSDHGNIECSGIGDIKQGVLTKTNGQRVRIYDREVLKKPLVNSELFVHEWKPNGLPEDYFPVFAGGNTAFVQKGKTIVSHGGLSLEEVIVPLIKIERN